MSAPRTGPCSPWTSGEQVLALPWMANAATQALEKGISGQQTDQAQIDLIAAQAAVQASELLYQLSGRVYSGDCGPVTVRPVARPADDDQRSWGASLSPMGWFSSWGTCSGYGAAAPGVLSHHGCTNPPEISLGAYPVTEVLQVLIDGVEIPGPFDPETGEGEWELRDHRWLIRIRPTASFDPTERWGWPTCQIQDLPDSQPGTFSVTYRYGSPPPASGALAALKLAEYLALPQLGVTTHYPQRVTQVSRQGVSTQVASVLDLMKTGQTGIYEVDLFLRSVNPKGIRRPAAVWSPDLGRARRTQSPTLPAR